MNRSRSLATAMLAALLGSLAGAEATRADDLFRLLATEVASEDHRASDDADIATPLQLTQAEVVPSPAPAQLPVAEPRPIAAPETFDTLARPIGAVTLDGAPAAQLAEQTAKLPEQFAIRDESLARFGDPAGPAIAAAYAPPRFAPTLFTWAAPAFYSRPLYFEQPNLERYGHHVALGKHDHLTQSVLSTAHFFGSVGVLPHGLGSERPDECSYVLGSYRPGSCNPHQLVLPAWSVGGLTLEGVAVTGLVFLIP